MEKLIYDTYVTILKTELVPALGCTEPIAIAYAAARARQLLDGSMPDRCIVRCSGNIVKNVKGVTVPNSGGLRGIEVSAILGFVGGDASRELAVLESVTDADRETTRQLLAKGICTCELVKGVENLYIDIVLVAGCHSAQVVIENYHSNITEMRKDGQIVFQKKTGLGVSKAVTPDKGLLNVKDILEFGATFDLDDLRETLERQEKFNSAISAEGLRNPYGAEVGRVLLGTRAHSEAPVKLKAKAFAAAGSDARMNGCSLPVVINSGSGNQGITVTLPIKVYAEEYGVEHDRFLRALAVGNLIAIHQKKYIGSLSAYCGAVSAACGAGAAITWMLGSSEMMGGTYQEVCNTITTTIATIGGMVCDGAKASCAAKISTAVEAALTAYQMSTRNKGFRPGEGLVKDTVEETIASVGRMGREGMNSTDIEILNIMLGN